MKANLKIVFLLFFSFLNAQERLSLSTHSIYFETGKYDLIETQIVDAIKFIKNTDSTRIESVQIFGYTDDVGNADYNFKLSTKRANTIQAKLIERGVKNKIIISIEGKGIVEVSSVQTTNIDEIRSKNRRVDIVLYLKPTEDVKPKEQFFYTEIQPNHLIGDHVYLENVYFEQGSSELSDESNAELDKIALSLLKFKTIEIEIQGHVCCTPPNQNEAYDRATRKRQLSTNRATKVYNYLISKQVDKSRMTYKGYGNSVPLGKEPEYDRRVELVIVKN